MDKPKLTIIIPAYNEINTIQNLINKISNLKIDKQIILIDDNSNDGTNEIIKKNNDKIDKIIIHNENKGKGAAIKSAQKFVEGKYVVIQDADLEYNPEDLYSLLDEIEKNNRKVVYGSRVLNNPQNKKSQNFSHSLRIVGNIFLTKFSNILNKQKLTDAHTCYKVFDAKVFKSLKLEENDFAFCPEVTSKVSKLGYKILERRISYNGRTSEEGKKIGIFDGFRAIYVLIKYNLLKN